MKLETDVLGFDPLGNSADGHILTRAIIDTIHEPLIVLSEDLRIIVASESFFKKFGLTAETTHGKMFYELSDGQFNIPALRTLLEDVIPKHTIIKDYEINHTFAIFGERTMYINAREIQYETGGGKMLLSIFDVTDQRAIEADREKLIVQKDLLLKEMQHRIANSLQLIASILLLKAATVSSKQSRSHLEDAHERILSIATVQRQLDPIASGEDISVKKYLTSLCKSLAKSMIGGRKPITLEVEASDGSVSSDTAVSFGLITTELVINSLKHAFPAGRKGKILVTYTSNDSGWSLQVKDDGVGQSKLKKKLRGGLGTSIIGALANQLHAIIRTESSSEGMSVSLIHTVPE